MAWRLAPSLASLRAELNVLAPDRDRTSDGTIGDQAHASRSSDHIVEDGVVHAIDLDHDPAHGADMNVITARVRDNRDRRIAYIIFNGRIWWSVPHKGYAAWAPAPYTGANAHAHHAHFSIWSRLNMRQAGLPYDAARVREAVDSTRSWFYRGGDMPDLTKEEIAAAVWDHALPNFMTPPDRRELVSAGTLLGWAHLDANGSMQETRRVRERLVEAVRLALAEAASGSASDVADRTMYHFHRLMTA